VGNDGKESGVCAIGGLKLDSKKILELPQSLDPNSSFEAGAQLTGELLQKGKPSFTALMAYDDVTALGALRR